MTLYCSPTSLGLLTLTHPHFREKVRKKYQKTTKKKGTFTCWDMNNFWPEIFKCSNMFLKVGQQAPSYVWNMNLFSPRAKHSGNTVSPFMHIELSSSSYKHRKKRKIDPRKVLSKLETDGSKFVCQNMAEQIVASWPI